MPQNTIQKQAGRPIRAALKVEKDMGLLHVKLVQDKAVVTGEGCDVHFFANHADAAVGHGSVSQEKFVVAGIDGRILDAVRAVAVLGPAEEFSLLQAGPYWLKPGVGLLEPSAGLSVTDSLIRKNDW